MAELVAGGVMLVLCVVLGKAIVHWGNSASPRQPKRDHASSREAWRRLFWAWVWFS